MSGPGSEVEINLHYTSKRASPERGLPPRGLAQACASVGVAVLASALLAGCISYTRSETQSETTLKITDNRPDCLSKLASRLRYVHHAQPLVGLFVGISNYGDPSRLWSTPAHSLSAALFREPFYLTAGSEEQKSDLRLFTALRLDPKSDVARAADRMLYSAGGISDTAEHQYAQSMRPPELRKTAATRTTQDFRGDGQPTTRQNLLDKLAESLERAEASAQKNGRVVFIFYVSAHGWIGPDGRSYILPSDADYDKPGTWIDQQEVLARTSAFLDRSRSDGRVRRAVLVFDTCRMPRGDLPEKLDVGVTRMLPNAVVVESTSPGSYAWHWQMQSDTRRETKILSESRWGLPLPPPKAKRGLIEEKLAAYMSVAPLASNCAISDIFLFFGRVQLGLGPEPDAPEALEPAVMDASGWLIATSRLIDNFTQSITEVKETGRKQEMRVLVPSTLGSIPLLELPPPRP